MQKTSLLWRQSKNLFGLSFESTLPDSLQWLLMPYLAIYLPNALRDSTDGLKSLFLILQCNQSLCSLSTNQIMKSTSIVLLNITSPNKITTQFENHVCEAVLPNTRPLNRDLCEKHSGNILSLQHFVTLPTYLTNELTANCTNRTIFPFNMHILSNY